MAKDRCSFGPPPKWGSLWNPFLVVSRLFPAREKALFSFYQHLLFLSVFFKTTAFQSYSKEERLQNLFLSWPCWRQITSLLSASVFYIIKMGIIIGSSGVAVRIRWVITRKIAQNSTQAAGTVTVLLSLLENSHVAGPHSSFVFSYSYFPLGNSRYHLLFCPACGSFVTG